MTAISSMAPQPINREWMSGRAVVDGRTIHVADLSAEATEYPVGAASRGPTARALVTLPMREGVPLGAMMVRCDEVRPFTDKQIELARDLRRPGGHRHRERAPVQELEARNRELRGAGAADGDRRDPAGHLELADGRPADVRRDRRERGSPVRRNEGTVFQFDGSLIHMVAHHGDGPRRRGSWRRAFPSPRLGGPSRVE